jgi:hypothetical protein
VHILFLFSISGIDETLFSLSIKDRFLFHVNSKKVILKHKPLAPLEILPLQEGHRNVSQVTRKGLY